MGKIFKDRLKEEDKKEGLLKRVKDIGDKNEELLKAFSAAKKVSNAAKNENYFNYDNKFAFYTFYRNFKKLKRMSLSSKYHGINDFHTLFNAFIKTHEASTTETKNQKERVMKR